MVNENATINADAVADAVRREIANLAQDVQDVYGLSVVEDEISRENGDWIVPVDCRASLATEKSYELHRVLSDIQHQAEAALKTRQSDVYVTIVLAH